MKIKIGTVSDSTGLVFAGYGKTYKNGEWWITKEKYELRKNKEALNAKKRYHQSEEKKNKILASNKKWRDGNGQKWVKSYESSETRREKRNNSERDKYQNSQEFREKKLEKSRKWLSSQSGREWDSNRKRKPEELEKRRNRRRIKFESNPIFRAVSRIRNRTYKVFSSINEAKSPSVLKIIGIDAARLKSFIESQFIDNMSWDNIGSWHIDHFIPIKTAKTISDVNRLSHYSNLRPMWAIDNLKKSSKIPSMSDVLHRNNFLDRWLAQMGGVTTQGMQQ